MKYTLRPAAAEDIDAVFSLYEKRVCWMNEMGIRQWNITDYLAGYPRSYYQKQQELGTLYVLFGETAAGAVVLLQEDERWPDKADDPAFYIHNLVTDTAVKGVGELLLTEVERIAKQQGKRYVRLDCAMDNAFLNSYYLFMGYEFVGTCQDERYIGNKREKKI